jgi:predicted MFS family arabinose efflux permease
MILAPSAVLPNVPPSRRGLASGLIFTGVGLGIALSGTLVPLLLQWGLSQAWAGLGVFSLILTGLAWHAWPPMQPPAVMPKGASGRYVAICVSYGLCAVGLVPHMVFLVDIVVRGQGRGLVAGSITWVLFGLGALCGPVVAGRLSDAIGATSAVRVMMLVELGAVLALIFIHIPLLGFVIIVPAGMVAPSITAVMLGRVQDAAGLDPVARQRGWTQATVAWAIGQAAAAYGLSWLYVATGGYAAPLDMAAVALRPQRSAQHLAALPECRSRQLFHRRKQRRGWLHRVRDIADNGGHHLGRGPERRGRNPDQDRGRSRPLRQHCQPAIGIAARLGADALGDLQLEHQRQSFP